jgi:O6-methylguanine-DNA--protein-cysteine methyltransferase
MFNYVKEMKERKLGEKEEERKRDYEKYISNAKEYTYKAWVKMNKDKELKTELLGLLEQASAQENYGDVAKIKMQIRELDEIIEKETKETQRPIRTQAQQENLQAMALLSVGL